MEDELPSKKNGLFDLLADQHIGNKPTMGYYLDASGNKRDLAAYGYLESLKYLMEAAQSPFVQLMVPDDAVPGGVVGEYSNNVDLVINIDSIPSDILQYEVIGGHEKHANRHHKRKQPLKHHELLAIKQRKRKF